MTAPSAMEGDMWYGARKDAADSIQLGDGARRARSRPAATAWARTLASRGVLALALGCALGIAPTGALGAAPADSRTVVLDVEGVGAWQGRNDVQSPNAPSSTRFALDALTGSGPFATGRVQLAWPFRERQEWRVLAAPLRVSAAGTLPTAVRFEGVGFAPGPARGRYQFDSWRVTWRYHWIDRPDLSVKLGFTAKLRDASIELRQGALRARKDNTGFVPLLHAAVARPLGSGWSVQGDVDALAGGPGYAIDAGVRLARDLGRGWSVHGGLRYLDGGADNDEVYAFATFTSVTLGVTRRFE